MFDTGWTLFTARRLAPAPIVWCSKRGTRRAAHLAGLILACFWLASCAGLVQRQNVQSAIAVTVTSPAATIQTSQSQVFTVSVQNDSSNRGVTWSLSGSGCSGPTCGTLVSPEATSVTYHAPATVPSVPSIRLTATSLADASKSASVTITIDADPLVSVSISPTSSSLQVSTSANFTASVQNDSQNKGVSWSLLGTGCSGATCGTLTNITTTAVTYTAPATVPAPATVTLTASSLADGTKSATATITVTAAPPQISVSVNPTTDSLQVSTSGNFAASVQNDSQNKGVSWSLSGTGCSGAACGTLTNVTTTAVTYTAPATVPTPAIVTLTATSIANGTKSAAATITVTAAPPPISVSVNPTTDSLQVSTSANFTAAVQNDSQNKGVSWSLSGAGCSGATCGTLSNVTPTALTYTAPATVPTPAIVTLTATSIANGTKSAAATITVTAAPPPISVSVNPTTDSLQVSTSANFAAAVQNDSQNKGVSWSLSGAGCSGATCGTLSNVTPTALTYTAPATVPTPAIVTLTATSIANGTKSAAATITVTAAPPPISVSVNPTTDSLQVSTSANFAATVQNDSQNKGVSWSLSGTGCSGATCGTLTNVTTTAVTYTAPATVPTPATVTLTAISVSDGTKTSLASITITQASSGGATPGFASNHVSGSSTQGNAVSQYNLRLPNGTMSGNCVVVGFQYSAGAGATATVSDDKGNAYSAPISHSDGNQIVNLSYALNVTAGAQKITITFSGGGASYVSALATEFYNIAPANALDGSSGNDGSGASVAAGAFTPANDGDLIYQYAVEDSLSNPINSWTQGASPWRLLSTDLQDASAAQYEVQTSAASVTPALGMSPSQNFLSVAIALKPGNSGSAPPPGIRVVRVQHHAVVDANSSVHLQFPCTGNLIVLAWIGAPGHDITGIADGNGNKYVSPGPAFGYGLSGDSQIYYVAGASTSSTMTGPTFTTSNTDSSGSTAILFDVSGAAALPYDTMAELSGNQTSDGNVTAVSISPSTANGLVITTIGVDSNSIAGVAPGNFLSSIVNPEAGENPVDENNGWALWYNTTAGDGTFVWNTLGGPLFNWSSVAMAFKAAP